MNDKVTIDRFNNTMLEIANQVKKNAEIIIKKTHDWRQKNPEKHNEQNRKRKLKKKQLFEDFTIDEWEKKVEKTKGICPICGDAYANKYPYVPTIDHTPPISVAKPGYHYTIDDVNHMCGPCNSSKSNSF